MEDKYYFAKGVIRYNDDWIIIECPKDIVNYYKFWVEKFLGKKISTSLHKPHITVLAGKHEKGFNKHRLWKRYEGLVVDFKYSSRIFTDHEWFFKGQYFWLRVKCPFVEQVRTELGLKPELRWPLHCTIGYCCY